MDLLLQVIRNGESIEPLLARGFEYSQIARLLSEAQAERLVQPGEKELVLTPLGEDYLLRAALSGRGTPADAWIRTLDEFRIARMSPKEIYLPASAPRAK